MMIQLDFTYRWEDLMELSKKEVEEVLAWFIAHGEKEEVLDLDLDEDGDGEMEWYRVEFNGQGYDKDTARIKITPYRNTGKLNEMKADRLNDESINYLYIKGDFTDSMEYARSYENSDYGGYCALCNNCVHFAQNTLKEGNFEKDILSDYVQNFSGRIPSQFCKWLRFADILTRRSSRNPRAITK